MRNLVIDRILKLTQISKQNSRWAMVNCWLNKKFETKTTDMRNLSRIEIMALCSLSDEDLLLLLEMVIACAIKEIL